MSVRRAGRGDGWMGDVSCAYTCMYCLWYTHVGSVMMGSEQGADCLFWYILYGGTVGIFTLLSICVCVGVCLPEVHARHQSVSCRVLSCWMYSSIHTKRSLTAYLTVLYLLTSGGMTTLPHLTCCCVRCSVLDTSFERLIVLASIMFTWKSDLT